MSVAKRRATIKNGMDFLRSLKNKLSFNNLKIKQKLVVLYVGAFFVPVLIVTAILTVWLHTILESWELTQAKTAVTQTTTLFKDILENTTELSDSLYVNKAVQETLLQQYKTPQEVYEQYSNTSFLDDFLRANHNVSSFRYYTENNTILDNAYFIKATPDITNSDWYKNAKLAGGRNRWVMKIDNITNKKTLSLVRSVWGRTDHKFVGVLSINLDTNKITRLLQSQENETLIAVNGRIEFSSREMPADKFPALLNTPITSESTQSFYSTWNDIKSAVLINSVYGLRNKDMLVVQIIPRTKLLTTTFQGILICLFIMLGGALVSLAGIVLFSHYFDKRVSYVNAEINKVVQNNFELGPRLKGTDEFAEIYDALSVTSLNIKTLIAEVYQHKIEQEQLLARQNDIRFKMLASQINPHFLFNTLETIRMQALADGNKDVAVTIKLLANILRHNLAVTDRPVPIMEEVEAVSNYLDIQHLRFADRVTYDIIFTCDVRDMGILPLLIQPVVENSFIHGLESRQKGGFIYICIDGDDATNLYITIRDNGIGIEPQKLQQLRKKLATGTVESINSSIGMVNVNQRIKLYYGEKYGIDIESEQGMGTTVTIHVPIVPLMGKGEGENG